MGKRHELGCDNAEALSTCIPTDEVSDDYSPPRMNKKDESIQLVRNFVWMV